MGSAQVPQAPCFHIGGTRGHRASPRGHRGTPPEGTDGWTAAYAPKAQGYRGHRRLDARLRPGCTGRRPEGTDGWTPGYAPRAHAGLRPQGSKRSESGGAAGFAPRARGCAPSAQTVGQRATPRAQRATPRGHRRLHTRLRPGAQGYAPRTQTVGHQATPRGRTQGHAPRAPNGLSPTSFGRNAKAPNLVPCQTHHPPPQGVGVWRRPSAPRRDPKSEKKRTTEHPGAGPMRGNLNILERIEGPPGRPKRRKSSKK